MQTWSIYLIHFYSKSKFSLLNKNLTFCARSNKHNKQNLNKDLLKFYHDIKQRAYFGSSENNSNEPRCKSNSNWLPDKLRSCVETLTTTSTNLATIVDKNLHTLEIEPKRKEIFAERPILRLKRNKNLKDIIGG